MAGMNEHIHFDCYPDFKEKIKKSAKEKGLTLSAYFRTSFNEKLHTEKLNWVIDKIFLIMEKLQIKVDDTN